MTTAIVATPHARGFVFDEVRSSGVAMQITLAVHDCVGHGGADICLECPVQVDSQVSTFYLNSGEAVWLIMGDPVTTG